MSSIKQNVLLPFMAKIGIGKTGSKNLTREEAREAMTAILRGEFDPVTFGAFLMGLRYKAESPEELAGFVDAMLEVQQQTMAAAGISNDDSAAPEGLISCGGAYDGKSRTCNVAIAAALVTSAAGAPVILHGTRGVPTKFGMTSSHVLEALGINVRKPLGAVADELNAIGISYTDQAELNPALHALLVLRSHVGKRTMLNTIEALANPFGARYLVAGFFHDAYADLIGGALAMEGMPVRRAAVVKGIEGSDELRAGGVFYVEVSEGQFHRRSINSDELGLPIHISELSARGKTVDERTAISLVKIRDLFANPQTDSAFRNAVLLNAGLRLYVAEKVGSVEEGIALALEALNSGEAGEKLRFWQQRNSR